MGKKTLFNAVFISPEQVVHFLLCIKQDALWSVYSLGLVSVTVRHEYIIIYSWRTVTLPCAPSSYQKYTLKKGNNDEKISKCSLLSLSGNDLIWKGDLDSLKTFVETELQINRRWSTPRGENFKFSNFEFSLKWDGETSKTITVVQDNDEDQLYTTLRSYATFTDVRVDQNLENKAEHVSNVDAEADITSHETSDNRQDSCEKCQLYDEDLTKLPVMVNEIKEKQNKECQNTIQNNSKIKALLDEKMVAEISALKTTVEEITEENRVIKLILDKKQHEWTKTEINSRKAKGKKANNTINPVASPNRFEVLEIQNMPDDSWNESVILEDHTDTMEKIKQKT